MRHLLIALAVALTPVSVAQAQRPTEGGMFSFDATDVVEHWDEPTGAIRVHYSVQGPNVTLLADDDADDVPDFAEAVAVTTAEVLSFYENDLGLRRPLSELDMGLGELGGSYALDVYLVDFGGNADGAFGIDACDTTPNHCAGYLTMENDFVGYGYPTLELAIDVLTSHELFHGVQNAYDGGQPVWFTEGTAVWAEMQFDPGSRDFFWFANAYLEDAGRSLDRPPTGPVPSFAYGTCLWWDFLTTRHDAALMEELLVAVEAATSEDDTLVEMVAVLASAGDTLEDAWLEFVAWNLATGERSGAMAGYSYADALSGVTAEAEGSAIDDDNRFYPLAATYYRFDHSGGPIWFGAEEAAPDLAFALHPVYRNRADGPVYDAATSWKAAQAGSWALADGESFPAGGYWLWGSLPKLADQSVKVRICLGSAEVAAACGAPLDDGEEEEPEEDSGGCAVSRGTRLPNGSIVLLAAALVALRRRRQ
jgi:hypothetical protein